MERRQKRKKNKKSDKLIRKNKGIRMQGKKIIKIRNRRKEEAKKRTEKKNREKIQEKIQEVMERHRNEK